MTVPSDSDSSRRDFLTGRAAQRELQRRGEEFADALLGEESSRQHPVGGDTVRLETRAMACGWSVILNPGDPQEVMVASDALNIVHQCEDQLTVFRETSEISRVNRLAFTEPQQVDAELFQFLLTCRAIWEHTQGAFDPAIGALIRLWKSARTDGRLPEQSEVDEALARSGMQHVLLDAEQQTIAYDRPGLLLDFGAIGKGYAVDAAAAHLHSAGVQDFLIHGGHSSLYAQGGHAGHSGWPVGIKNPLFTDRRYATLLLRDQGMSTSGSNIQYFRHDGQRYGHLLDPRTGWPASELLSVTVLAPTAAEADALSTAFYILGLDKALLSCDDRKDVGIILIPTPNRDGTLKPIVRNLADDCLYFE